MPVIWSLEASQGYLHDQLGLPGVAVKKHYNTCSPSKFEVLGF